MATYAAYRHVELDNVGYGKKRVLKPPGGGSSDIFGSGPEESCPRRVKSHNQSQLGSAFFGQDSGNANGSDSVRSTKPGNDSYNRLFGPPDVPPSTPKNHMRSNIALSGESSPAKSTCSSSATTASSSSSSSVSLLLSSSSLATVAPAPATTASTSMSAKTAALVNGHAAVTNGTGKGNTYNDVTDGNPVTGTGYADQPTRGSSLQNGTSSPGEKSSDSSSPPSSTGKTPTRNRVPPGGYSSGLW